MSKPNRYTFHKHKTTNFLMRLASTENGYYFLTCHHWTWFGTYQEFTEQFQPHPILGHRPKQQEVQKT